MKEMTCDITEIATNVTVINDVNNIYVYTNVPALDRSRDRVTQERVQMYALYICVHT